MICDYHHLNFFLTATFSCCDWRISALSQLDKSLAVWFFAWCLLRSNLLKLSNLLIQIIDILKKEKWEKSMMSANQQHCTPSQHQMKRMRWRSLKTTQQILTLSFIECGVTSSEIILIFLNLYLQFLCNDQCFSSCIVPVLLCR